MFSYQSFLACRVVEKTRFSTPFWTDGAVSRPAWSLFQWYNALQGRRAIFIFFQRANLQHKTVPRQGTQNNDRRSAWQTFSGRFRHGPPEGTANLHNSRLIPGNFFTQPPPPAFEGMLRTFSGGNRRSPEKPAPAPTRNDKTQQGHGHKTDGLPEWLLNGQSRKRRYQRPQSKKKKNGNGEACFHNADFSKLKRSKSPQIIQIYFFTPTRIYPQRLHARRAET